MSITVHCTHCQTGFPVDPDKIPEGGVRVRCTTCDGIFRVEKPAPEPEVAVLMPEVQAEPAFEAAPAFDEEPAFEAEPEAAAEPEIAAEPEVQAEPEVVAEPEVEAEIAPVVEESPEIEIEESPMAEVEIDEPAASEAEPTASAEDEAVADAEEWVFETEESIDGSSLDVTPMDTVEGQVRSFQEEEYETPESDGIGQVVPGREEETFAGYDALVEVDEPLAVDEVELAAPAPEEEHTLPEVEISFEADPEPEAEPETPAASPAAAPAPQGFQFGKRDPNEKAQRLARVLVSDMITYNPERHQRALAASSLVDDFEDEIAKSWAEYTGQVGLEIAESTPYWTDALNAILAKGEKVF